MTQCKGFILTAGLVPGLISTVGLVPGLFVPHIRQACLLRRDPHVSLSAGTRIYLSRYQRLVYGELLKVLDTKQNMHA